MTYKKVSPRRNKDLLPAKRTAALIRRQAAEVRALMKQERELLVAMLADRAARAALIRGAGLLETAFSSWADFEGDFAVTSLSANALPRWEDCSEYLKFQIGFHAGLELGCTHFTARIHPSLLQKWQANSSSLYDLVRKRLNKELNKTGFGNMAYGFVIEAVSRRGRSKVPPHLHGYLVPGSPEEITAFKVALERAFLNGQLEKIGRQRPVLLGPAHDQTQDGRWVNYIFKGITRYHAEIGPRRFFMSDLLTGGAREAWRIMRDDRLRHGCIAA